MQEHITYFKPHFSVTYIIACYNEETTIVSTIESILLNCINQDEIIIVDAVSTDNTLARIDELQIPNTSLTVISEPDLGIYDAWNKAIKLSTKEWLVFIGSGDMLRTNYRELINFNYEKSSKVNFIHFKARYYISAVDNQFRLGFLGRYLIKNNFVARINICHVASLHHRSLFQKHQFSTKYKIVSDYEFLLKNLSILNPLFIDDVLVDMEATGISSSSFDNFIEELIMKFNLGPKYFFATLLWIVPRLVKRAFFITKCKLINAFLLKKL